MSESEKIKEVPKPPPEQPKESSTAPKTAQSAFDKILEQQKILQQSPIAQGKVADQGTSEQRVKEASKQRDQSEEKQKKDDRDETSGKDRIKQKEKGSETITREAVTRSSDKKGSGGGSGGSGGDRGGSGFGSTFSKRQVLDKKLADIRGLMASLGKSPFAGKLAQARAGAATLKPAQMQTLVNQIVQAIRVGKNGLGEKELSISLRDSVFKGLRLRFTSKNGKVLVQFETRTRDVKDLFTAESAKIQTALEEKGIAVEKIVVS